MILWFSVFETSFLNVGQIKQTFKDITLEVWFYSDVLFDRLIQIKDATLDKIKVQTGDITKRSLLRELSSSRLIQPDLQLFGSSQPPPCT